MNKSRKLIALFLMLALTVTFLLSGCGSGNNTATTTAQAVTTQGNAAETTAGGPFAKHLELAWIGHIIGFSPNENTEVQKLVEEKFNVTIKPVKMDYQNEEQWNLYWASGNTADYITLWQGMNWLTKLADQGLIREIDFDTIEKNAPALLKKVESYIPKDTVKKQLAYNGKIYSMPYSSATDNMPFIDGVRKDWLENVGITKVPETLDEYHDMLVKFTKNDPDRNGKNDTYGMDPSGAFKGNNNGFGTIFGAFGIQAHAYYVKDGQVYYTSTSEEYKNAVKTMAAWYKEGLLDPEFVTDTRDIQRKKWADGKFGVLYDHPWWYAQSTVDNLSDIVTRKNPDAKIEFIDPPKGPDGKSGGAQVFPGVLAYSIAFGKNTSDEKVERIMAIKEAFCTDWDFYVRCYYGEEGKQYTKDKDGIIAYTEEYRKTEKQAEFGMGPYYSLIPVDMEHFKKITFLSDLPPYEVSARAPKSYLGVAFVASGTSETYKTRGVDIEKVRDEFFFNAVTGKKDIDSEWDNYVKRINEAGLEQVVKEYQELYDKSNK